jgi:hypothetical protein
MDLLDLDRRALADTGAHVRTLAPDVFGTPIFFAEQQPCPTDAPPDVLLVATLGHTA